MKNLDVNAENAEQRLDKYLLKYLNKAPKSFVYKMLRKKNIVLNGKKAAGSEILCVGDVITIYVSDAVLDGLMEERTLNSTSKKINIVYEDENILICDKPAGLLSHSDNSKSGKSGETMIDRILFYLNETKQLDKSKASVFTPALCGRLDRNTSGLVICGKNYRTLQRLNKAMAEKKIGRYYTALVSGELGSGVLKGWHIKDSKTNEVRILDQEIDGAREAVTEYRALKNYGNFTLAEIKLITGRSHQIRAHLQSIGHSIIGDMKYGDAKEGSAGQLLHCGRLVFEEEIQNLEYLHGREFLSPLPEKFLKRMNVRGINK